MTNILLITADDMDGNTPSPWSGSVLAALEGSGAAGETLVVFLSDNGMAFPFAKANCYLRSTLTPLIVRWPGVSAPGSENAEEFVNMLDLFPHVLRRRGRPPGAGGPGRVFPGPAAARGAGSGPGAGLHGLP